MSTHTATPPAELLTQLRALHRAEPAALSHDLPELGLRPLADARNNRVYAWNSPDGTVCLKLYRTDKRDRAACEHTALQHIAAHRLTAGPQALWHDPHPELPAVAMTFLAGEPLPHLTGADLDGAIHAAVDVLSELRHLPLGPFADLARVDSAANYVRRLAEVWPEQLRQQPDDPLTTDLTQLLAVWHDHGDAETLAEPAPRVLSRGDSNLLNWLWNPTTIHVVDWEFTGHSDPAYDAAELIEHLSARCISDTTWLALLPRLGITDPAGRRRFRAAQRTVALRWLAVLWKRRHEREEEFENQRIRATDIIRNAFV